MAVLSVQNITRAGFNLDQNDVAAAGGGDSFPNTGQEMLYVRNGGGSQITVTLAYQVTFDGQTIPSKTVAVPAGEAMLIGPFPTGSYNDANSRANVTYSGVTSVTVAALKLTG
jgi:hypothetical protein